MTIRAKTIRFKAWLAVQKNKLDNILFPGARQDSMGVAIEVVTEKPVGDFLDTALTIAHGNFENADTNATESNEALEDAKVALVVAETKRASKKKQLETIVGVTNKQK